MKVSLIIAIVLLGQVAGTREAFAAYQSGDQLWTDCAYVGGTCVSAQWEVFLGVSYTYVSGTSQIQIASNSASVEICAKNAGNTYSTFGWASALYAQWYINNGSGDIDSDSLNGDTSGIWQACSGSADWMFTWKNGSYHWPPIGTELRVPSSYCYVNYGCTTWRSTYTGWMN